MMMKDGKEVKVHLIFHNKGFYSTILLSLCSPKIPIKSLISRILSIKKLIIKINIAEIKHRN